MKPIYIFLCLITFTSTLFAEDPNISSWSQVVNGLQVQITMKEANIVNETQIISSYFSLRNVSDIGNPMKIDWDNAKLTFRVIDEKGNELVKGIGPYDGTTVDIGTLVLPYDSTLTFNISKKGLGIPKGKAALLDVGPENNWIIDKADQKYFLSAVLTIEDNGKPRNQGYWHGTIDIPKAEIPLVANSGGKS